MLKDYQEIDSSPMATQQEQFFEDKEAKSPTTSFRNYCEQNPWALECKIYED
jgi:hypothetical protein